jgi:Dockerin type I domain
LCGTFSAIVIALTSTALSAPQTYFGGPDESKNDLTLSNAARNNFLANLSSWGIEDLETLGGQINPTLAFSGTGITAATGFSNGVQSETAFSVSGKNFLLDTEGVDDWLQFSQPVTAFGAYLTQSGDGPSRPPISTPPNRFSFRLENTVTGTSKDVFIANLGPDWPFYNVVFVGVTDTEPFNRISFVESYDHDGILPDDLIAGFVAPLGKGDFNRDGVVNQLDVSEMLKALADLDTYQSVRHLSSDDLMTIADVNHDGTITNADIQAELIQIASGAGGIANVPEPLSSVLLMSGIFSMLGLAMMRNRRARGGV